MVFVFPNTFVLVDVELVPNEKFDDIFETMEDFEKYDFTLCCLDIYCIENDDNENESTVIDAMKDGVFWCMVKDHFRQLNYQNN